VAVLQGATPRSNRADESSPGAEASSQAIGWRGLVRLAAESRKHLVTAVACAFDAGGPRTLLPFAHRPSPSLIALQELVELCGSFRKLPQAGPALEWLPTHRNPRIDLKAVTRAISVEVLDRF
jgi:hypothetical protein